MLKKGRLAAVVLTAATLVSTGFSQAITNVIDGFDPAGIKGNPYNSGEITNVWMNWFGGAFQSLSWDSNNDAASNPNSGSMKINLIFDNANSNQFAVYDGLTGITPPVSAKIYANFECDIRFAAGSATETNGGIANFGEVQFGIAVGFTQDYFGGISIPATNTNWVHVKMQLDPHMDPNLTNITDVLIHIYGPYFPGPSTLNGPSTLWVDNIKFTGTAPAPTNCVVNWTDTHQTIDGFGASSAWNSGLTQAQMDMFYSTNTGVGLSLLRTRIAPGGTTVEGAAMQMAQSNGARIWSTPWSPDAAFKDTNSVNGGDFVSTNNQAYANQIANYVLNVKNTYGVNLYAVSVQNEPDQSTTYESCLWTGQQMHDYIPYLYNALSNNGVSSTKILMPEFSSWNFAIASNTLADPVTSNMVGVLAGHDYDYTVSPVNSGNKRLWETEVSTFDNFDGSIGNGLYWAEQIHAFLTEAQVNAWHFWWLIPIDGLNHNEGLTDMYGNPAKRMYVLGNYSRFVRPGFVRIGVSNNAPTYISAYKDTNTGNFAIVAINALPANYTQTFNLSGFGATTVTPWVTSATLSLAKLGTVTANSSVFSYSLPASSVVTFVGQETLNVPTIAVHLAGTKPVLTIGGPALGNYTIWSSTDLVNWTSVLTTNPPIMPTNWMDPSASVATRYYRVSLSQ
jgi:glucuronoarabinoxylan endo-1,4-beta-xylanase